MPNIASVLREEITRLSRRASRKDLDAVKKASAQLRRHIAAIKRDVAQLARHYALLVRKLPVPPVAANNGEDGKPVRFVATALRSRRERLGISAGELAKLVGVSAQSVYNWEHGVTRPREAQLTALAALRTLGKREVRARLQHLDDSGAAKRRPGSKASRARKRAKPLARRRAKP